MWWTQFRWHHAVRWDYGSCLSSLLNTSRFYSHRLPPYSTQITHLMSNSGPNETVTLNKIRFVWVWKRFKHLGACELHNNIFQKTSNLDLKYLKKNVGLQLTTFLSLRIWWLLFWLCRVIVWSMKCQRKAVSTNHNQVEDDCDCDAFFFPETVQNSKISNLQLCKNTAEMAGNPPTGEAGTCFERFRLQKWLWLFIKSTVELSNKSIHLQKEVFVRRSVVLVLRWENHNNRLGRTLMMWLRCVNYLSRGNNRKNPTYIIPSSVWAVVMCSPQLCCSSCLGCMLLRVVH